MCMPWERAQGGRYLPRRSACEWERCMKILCGGIGEKGYIGWGEVKHKGIEKITSY